MMAGRRLFFDRLLLLQPLHLAAVADERGVGDGPAVGAAVAEADAEGVLGRLGRGEGGLEGAVLSAALQSGRFEILDNELLDGDRAAVNLSE